MLRNGRSRWAETRTLYLMFNNHARGQAAQNGQGMIGLLGS